LRVAVFLAAGFLVDAAGVLACFNESQVSVLNIEKHKQAA